MQATRRDRSVPVRTCVGCGRRAPKQELVRFETVDGMVREADTPTGRGVYTCRDAECWEHAVEGRGFARSLRRPVAVEPELARLYTGVSHG